MLELLETYDYMMETHSFPSHGWEMEHVDGALLCSCYASQCCWKTPLDCSCVGSVEVSRFMSLAHLIGPLVVPTKRSALLRSWWPCRCLSGLLLWPSSIVGTRCICLLQPCSWSVRSRVWADTTTGHILHQLLNMVKYLAESLGKKQ